MTNKRKIILFLKKSGMGRLVLKFVKFLFKFIQNLKFLGFKHKCIFCGFWAKKFLSAGLDQPVLKDKRIVARGLRRNVHCPNCMSSDRERLVFLYLKKKTNFFSKQGIKSKVLHVAPEKNLQKKFKQKKNIEYFSVDLNSALAEYKMDIQDIKFADNFFDLIICNHVLEHIEDDSRAMGELYRVLKPGGLAILQVPIALNLTETFEDFSIKNPKERELIFGQYDHVRIYGQDYKNRLELVGFKVDIFEPAKEWGEKSIKKNALILGEDVYACKKLNL